MRSINREYSLFHWFLRGIILPTVTQTIAYQIGDRLYLSITDHCTLDCAFCPKTRGDFRVGEYDLRMQRRPSAEELIAAIGDPRRYAEVVFCGYGEPTLRLNLLLRVAAAIKQAGGRVRVDTDGLSNLVHKGDTLPELGRVVDSLSISLNAQDEATYERHCRPNLPGSYRAVLEFLRRAPQHVPEVTATAIEGLEGVDIDACRRLAEGLGVRFRKRILGQLD
jgi:TatD family-associated radical SAM protein